MNRKHLLIWCFVEFILILILTTCFLLSAPTKENKAASFAQASSTKEKILWEEIRDGTLRSDQRLDSLRELVKLSRLQIPNETTGIDHVAFNYRYIDKRTGIIWIDATLGKSPEILERYSRHHDPNKYYRYHTVLVSSSGKIIKILQYQKDIFQLEWEDPRQSQSDSIKNPPILPMSKPL